MPEDANEPRLNQREPGRQFSLALLAGFVVVLILAGGFYLWSRSSGGPAAPPAPLPMGPVEQAYAPQIKFSDFQLSRATNMLKTEITYIDGVITNTGNRPIVQFEMNLDFKDLQGKTMYHDTRRLPLPGAPPYSPGEKRDFELTFENVPVGWDQRPPDITIIGLRLK
jgi:hypothetical protein